MQLMCIHTFSRLHCCIMCVNISTQKGSRMRAGSKRYIQVAVLEMKGLLEKQSSVHGQVMRS